MLCSGMREGKESIQWFLEVPISGRREGGVCSTRKFFSLYFCKIKFETVLTYSIHL